MDNKELAQLLEETGVLKRLAGENDFKAAAYDRAARQIENMETPIAEYIEGENVDSISGIGKSLATQIYAYADTGRLPVLDALHEQIPSGLIKWLDIPGLGPKKIYKVHRELGITEMAELVEKCRDGSVAELKGMGEKTAEKILSSIAFMEKFGERCRADQAASVAKTFNDFLFGQPGVDAISLAGSSRRRLETIGDIDILVAAKELHSPSIMEAFTTHPDVVEILAKGDTKSSIRTREGRQVDLRVIPEKHFAAALMYFTGSKEHNIATRARARERGMALNEYGLFQLDDKGDTNFDEPVNTKTEADIYRELDLPFIEPELREDRGEFAWFESHEKIDLLQAADIQGILHAHSTWSDGACTIHEMALGCIERGYSYLGLTDHSRAAAYAGGLTAERVEAQWKEIDQVNQQLADEGHCFHVFKGIESDILGNGELDYEEEILAGFDFIIASVHSALDMEAGKMLERMQKAAANPYCTIIGHPTGRLLLKRKGSEMDLNALVEHCADHKTVIEINANPRRLDLDWRYGRKAHECGMMTSINPDAHNLQMLDDMEYGVGVARKGWYNPERVLNTKSLEEISTWFETPKNERI